MPVTNALIRVDSSVCTRGWWLDTMAIRSCRIVTSPPRIRPSRRSPSSLPASSASREEFTNVRSAPFTIVHPDSTSRSSDTLMTAGSWYSISVRVSGEGFGNETNSGSTTAARRALPSARSAPARPRSLGSHPNPTRRPSGPSNTAWIPSPYPSTDFGSSTPLHGMCDV